jgi:predicted nucleic acid-binding protein
MALTVVDAGVLIALGDTTDAYHRVSQSAIRRARDAGAALLLPASAFAEVLVGPVSRHGAVVGRERVQRVLALLAVEVVPIDERIAVAAALLRAKHGSRMRLPDALVVATAVTRRASVMTTDSRWPQIRSVKVTVVRRRPGDARSRRR